MRKPMRLIALLGVAAMALTGCAGEASTEAAPLEVHAAASLKEPMTELMSDYQAEHPDMEFAPLTTAGSQQLVQQVNEGAPVDVLALADETSLTQLEGDHADGFEIFVENSLVVVTTEDAAARIKSVADLADSNNKVVICHSNVPCGRATERLFAEAGVSVSVVSEEDNVKAVLTKVTLGEADAGLVYRSDVVGVDGVEFFAPEEAAEIVNRYPIGALSDHPHVQSFIDYVRGEHGREVLERYGFLVPEDK